MARQGSTGHEQEKANVYVTVNLKLLGKDVSCLLDSGCDLTLVPKDLIRSYRNVHVKPTRQQLYAANSTLIATEGKVRLPFFLDGHCLWTNALVSEDVEEVMLGIDWLEQYECIWDFKSGKLRINGYPAVTLTRRGHIKCQRVIVQD